MFPATIKIRCGHRIHEVSAQLPKPASELKVSEVFEAEVEGRLLTYHVEIPISEHCDVPYIAADYSHGTYPLFQGK